MLNVAETGEPFYNSRNSKGIYTTILDQTRRSYIYNSRNSKGIYTDHRGRTMKGKIYNSRNSKGIYTHETQRSPIFESTIVEILKVFTPGTVWASVDWASTIVEILKVFTPKDFTTL